MLEKDLGFNKENIVFLQSTPDIRERIEILKNELMQHPNIGGLAVAEHIPGGGLNWTGTNWRYKLVWLAISIRSRFIIISSL